MKRGGRRTLSAEEAALWARVAQTVAPLPGRKAIAPVAHVAASMVKGEGGEPAARARVRGKPAGSVASPVIPEDSKPRPIDRRTLDAGWDRKLGKGAAAPDFTLDLHGASLDAAHGRLLHGLSQARATGARVVLVVTGKPRPVDPADRGTRRGAIRAKVIDWLAHSEHAADIAAVRGAHRRHGGEGALYVVLKRRR